MIKSMTAYGRAKHSAPQLSTDFTVEIKSVNSKFLDLSVKLPRQYTFLEDKIRNYLQQRGISRGKVELYLGVEIYSSEIEQIAIDEVYAKAYIESLRHLRDTFGLADDITTMTVAQNRELFNIRKGEHNAEDVWQTVLIPLEGAVSAFLQARANEGARIESDLRAKVQNIKELTAGIDALSAQDVSAKYEKLCERIKKIVGDNNIVIDEQRLLTECAIFADKIAIDEELVRLRSHFQTFEEILSKDSAVGRNLDFLLQEINREINTIGSKCNNSETAKIVVNVKCEIEKIREQIQNIE